ncbi:unnamed protein product [Arabidopsis thaliana]|uniref:(thale cress) hypothetical protein n=1 Tax=Arabidopsis thaliana TaxID=3702 RepID=A0A7G2DTK4_ARATH|nr:unnamed protein product [Arabidopsis thaliana]
MSLPNLNVTGRGSPYFLTDENCLVMVGCGTKALMKDIESEILGCESSCEDSKSSEEEPLRICYCNYGYTGNPYLRHGCIDIDECEGHHNCGEGTCVNMPGTHSCEPKITKPEKASVLQGVLINTDSCEGNHNCGEDAHCVNMPGPMSMCRPNPKITKPTKPPVLQGILIGTSQPLTPPPLNVAGQGSPYFLTDKNLLVAVGCKFKAVMAGITSQITSCESSCNERNSSSQEGRNKICNGYKCCQTRIPEGQPQVISVDIEIPQGNNTTGEGGCRVAFLTSDKYSSLNVTEPEKFHGHGYAVVELGWFFDTSDSRDTQPISCKNASDTTPYTSDTRCSCSYGYFSGFSYRDCYCNSPGYKGNPFLPGGCVDVDECKLDIGRNQCKDQSCVNLPGWFDCQPKKPEQLKRVIQGVLIGLDGQYISAPTFSSCVVSSTFNTQAEYSVLKTEPFSGEVVLPVFILTPDFHLARVEVQNPYGVVHIKGPVTSLGCSSNTSQGLQKTLPDLNITGRGSPYFLTDENRLVAVGCGTKALMTDIESEILGCESSCKDTKSNEVDIDECEVPNKCGEDTCVNMAGRYSCVPKITKPAKLAHVLRGVLIELEFNQCVAATKTRIPEGQPQVIGVNIEIPENKNTTEGGCKVAFLTSNKYSSLNVTEPEEFHSDGYAVVELGWYFDTSDSRVLSPIGCMNVSDASQDGGYGSETICVCSYGYFSGFSYRSCYCNSMGYAGNPFLPGGCVDIDECKLEIGRKRCKDQSCVNKPGWFTCEPKKPGQIKPVFQGVLIGCSSNTSQVPQKSLPDLNVTGKGSPYFITDENRLVAVGCGTKALMTDIESEILGCESSCKDSKSSQEVTNLLCDGYKCCQARIPVERPQAVGVNIESSGGDGCKVAFLSSKRYSPSNVTIPEQFHAGGYVVVELGWYFATTDSRFRNPLGCINLTDSGSYLSGDSCLCEYGYFSEMSYRNCYCSLGFTGNPYLRGGCIDNDDCKGPNICEEGTCVNVPGGYRCDPKPKIIKPAKPLVLQGEFQWHLASTIL